jgi:DNA (cytosine-5)-methyltransferase 1
VNRIYKIVSLFSGAGGFDWGFHLTGKFTTSLANELRADPAQTLVRNLKLGFVKAPFSPDLENQPLMMQGDIADICFANLNGFQPEVLIGGPPCQDFSIVKGGVRRGIEVKRGKLYAHFIRAIVALQPKVFVFENVPGLVSANKGWAYKAILDDFRNLTIRWQDIRESAQLDNDLGKPNYTCGYEILFSSVVDVAHLGVPQSRRRLIIIGLRRDLADKLGVFEFHRLRESIHQRLSGSYSLVSRYPMTCLEVFEGKPLCDLQTKYREIMLEYKGLWEEVATTQAAVWRQRVWNRLTFNIITDYILFNGIVPKDNNEIDSAMEEHARLLKLLGYFEKPVYQLELPDGTHKPLDESEAVKERMRRIPPGENHQFVRGTPWHVEGRGLSLIYKRPLPIRPAPTVVAYGGGGTWGYHYERSRTRLTNRERARLQTFTDNFLFVGGVSSVRAQIGEAVPPLLAFRIAEAVAEILANLP